MRAEQTTKCSVPFQKLRAKLGPCLTSLSPPPFSNTYITDRSKAERLWFSLLACFGVSFCTVVTFSVSRCYVKSLDS